MKTVANTTVAGSWPPPPGPPLLPKVDGYEVLDLVGRGGMGRVYRARQIALDRIVALKLLGYDSQGDLLARFREEARAIARLQHPNIAQLFETGIADGIPYYTQEFLDGGTLAALLDGKPLDPRAAAAMLELVARAIQHSHENGILHRDLKPANILLTADRTPKVTDFGLAKTFRANPGGETPTESGGGLTRTGQVLGTPAYMPPEQASGVVADLGPAADVYGLGAILYELLTGRPPFQGPDAMQTLLMVLSMDPVPPRTLQPKLPKDLETICLKCLEKNPRRRYPTARALADDLKRFLNGEPIVARPVGFFERAGKWARRKKALAALVAVSLIAGAMLIGSGVALTVGYLKLRTANSDLETKNDQLAKANGEIIAANAETQRTLGFALESVDHLFFDFSDQVRNTPGGSVLRRSILNEARVLLDRLGNERPADPVIRKYRANGYYKLGSAEDALGRHREAAEALDRARTLYADLVKEVPDQLDYQARYALATLMLANKRVQLGDPAAGAPLRDEAFRLSDALIRAHPGDVGVLKLADLVEFNRYGIALAEGNRAEEGSPLQKAKDKEGEAALRLSIEHCKRAAALAPEDASLKLQVIDRELSLAGFLTATGRTDEAERLILAAKDRILTGLPEKPAPNVRVLAATLWSSLGQLHFNQNRYADAEKEYVNTFGLYDGLARDFVNNPLYAYQAARARLHAGIAAQDDKRYESAREHYQAAVDALTRLNRGDPANLQYQDTLKSAKERINSLPPPGKTP